MEFITEFTRSQIAALVLGYLRSEKCYKAFNKFLEESPFFQKHKQNIKKGKYFVTRVAGLCLVDLLEEYAAIYSIVQGRLEASNYYNEVHMKGTLVDQILYLLDKDCEMVRNSTPFRDSRSPTPPTLSTKGRNLSGASEVDATPVHALPGNGVEETDSFPKTPKKRSSRSFKNLDKDEAFDVSDVLTQTLLDNHELHEKIAETINIVRNTPETGKTVAEEHISIGASKELDAIIKTVVQRTEEDPVYNKLIDEIIGTAPFENPPVKKANTSCNTSHNLETKRNSEKIDNQSTPTTNNRIEDHNDDAIRSIIEASQNTEAPPPPAPPQNNETNKNENGEVYVFDGTFDTYLKTSGAANPIPPNPVYINTGGLIVMPPETTSKQFYIVNNQPLINMNVSTVKGMISDNDIMSMPTIIVNDETQATFATQNLPPICKNLSNKRNKVTKIAPKPEKAERKILNEFLNLNKTPTEKKNKTVKSDLVNSLPVKISETVVTATQTTPSVITAPSPRSTSHVRNLDFSTPTQKDTDEEQPANRKVEGDSKTWDADLRSLVATNCVSKCPTPKRKRPVTARSKKSSKTKNKFEEKLEEKKEEETKEGDEVVKEQEKVEEPEKEEPLLATPVKNDTLPKTPGGKLVTTNNNIHCTPFTDVLEEQLRGIDLISLPTPKIPITPGFALNLTHADVPPYNRSTDYSTSSSYYQPSDTEQNKSLEQLIEECKKLESKSPPPPLEKVDNTKMKILSDVVIEHAKVTKTHEKKSCDEHLKKFNHNVIGKKNLNLLKPSTSSSSSDSDSSDTESEKSEELATNTAICKEGDNTVKKSDAVAINDIINTVEVKKTLEDTRKKDILLQLEEVRKRTIHKIKNPPEATKKTRRNNKKTVIKTTPKDVKRKRNIKKKESSVEETNTDEEAQKLVKGLWQRGIHLMPKKTPKKNSKLEKPPPIPAPPPPEDKHSDDSSVSFDNKIYEDFETITYEEKAAKGKSLESYNFAVLKKGFEATVYAEHLQKEITRTMRWTQFETLADLPTKITVSSSSEAKQVEDILEDELMDYVIVGSVREESPEPKQISRGGKKRKSRLSEDDNKQAEKKSKTYEKNIKLLKKIDVDVFLDKVHGE